MTLSKTMICDPWASPPILRMSQYSIGTHDAGTRHSSPVSLVRGFSKFCILNHQAFFTNSHVLKVIQDAWEHFTASEALLESYSCMPSQY